MKTKGRSLAVLSLLLLTNLALSDELICGSTSASHKRTYPINKAALDLASRLGLKTCTGTSSKRFKREMKRLKHTGKFVVVSEDELIKAQDSLRKRGGRIGPSFN